MQTILVTGGAGFIASHITDFLLLKGYKVRVLDNFYTGFKENAEHNFNNSNFEFFNGDLRNINIVKMACQGVDAICHQAALGSVFRSIDDPLNSYDINVNGLLNILVSAKEAGIKRIVYASSSSVYGDDKNLPRIESKIGSPLSPYALTKLTNELSAKLFCDLYGLECIGLRYFNVFGPRQNASGTYIPIIPKIITSLRDNNEMTIHGDGSFTRDFTYVSNIVAANYLALTSGKSENFGEVFNIGSERETSIIELFDIIKNFMGKNCKISFSKSRLGDISHARADISKAKNLLGYKPDTNLIDGLKKTIDYYCKK
jgi:UDP-N-acetylglucosamine 4-epimerase